MERREMDITIPQTTTGTGGNVKGMREKGEKCMTK